MVEKTINLLLVEDNPGDVRLFKEFLKSSGDGAFHMEHVSSLASGLNRLHHNHLDLILLDLALPDGTGLQTLQDVHHASPQIPIIILTGSQDETLAMESLQNGAQDYLIKGQVNGDLLVRAVRYALERFTLFQKVREEQQRYELAAIGSNDGLWDWNLTTDRMYFSTRWKLMLGYPPEAVGETPDEWLKRVHPDDLTRVQHDLTEHLARKTPHFANEHRLQHKDEGYRWVLSRGIAVFNPAGKAVRMAGSFTDITDYKHLEQSLAQQAYYDPLTRLPNRVLFMENLKRSFAHAQRNSNYLYAVLFLDMDRFKFINDSFGHLSGDRLLVEFATRLRVCVRPNDLVARIGGDEFNILLEDLKDPAEAITVAERILKEFQDPFIINETEILLSASIGVAFSSNGCPSPEELLKAADNAMYRAKALGKARYEIYDTSMHARSVDTLKLEADFRRALQKQEFFTLYQPIADLKTGHIVGAEVLLRWQHPHRGLLGPAHFIPLIEETGLLGRLDELSLRAACAQNKVWHAAGHNDLWVSINLSAQQVRNPHLPHLIQKVLEEMGLDSRLLEVEIPGWLVIKERLDLAPIFHELQKTGVQIAIDHYGVGLSSLKDMRDFPIHNIKIDRDFIKGIEKDSFDNSLIGMIITAAHGMGIHVTATEVEKESESNFLRKNECDYIQGSIFSAPLTADQFTQLLTLDQKILK